VRTSQTIQGLCLSDRGRQMALDIRWLDLFASQSDKSTRAQLLTAANADLEEAISRKFYSCSREPKYLGLQTDSETAESAESMPPCLGERLTVKRLSEERWKQHSVDQILSLKSCGIGSLSSAGSKMRGEVRFVILLQVEGSGTCFIRSRRIRHVKQR
jgi:hypothetical protein